MIGPPAANAALDNDIAIVMPSLLWSSFVFGRRELIVRVIEADGQGDLTVNEQTKETQEQTYEKYIRQKFQRSPINRLVFWRDCILVAFQKKASAQSLFLETN